jgi:hypothetical protein
MSQAVITVTNNTGHAFTLDTPVLQPSANTWSDPKPNNGDKLAPAAGNPNPVSYTANVATDGSLMLTLGWSGAGYQVGVTLTWAAGQTGNDLPTANYTHIGHCYLQVQSMTNDGGDTSFCNFSINQLPG